MIEGFIAKKLNMGKRFDKEGRAIPVTYLDAKPNLVVGLKDREKDNYESVQLGFGEKKKVNKPQEGLVKKRNLPAFPEMIKEVAFKGEVKIGDTLRVEDILKIGDLVNVRGISKGKGFTGVVKRHGFRGGPKTHGQSDRFRHAGSIGATTTPGRVLKGKKMAGHKGVETVTVKNLEVIGFVPEENTLVLKGAIPGNRGSAVLIKRTGKTSKRHVEQPVVVKGEKEEPEGETNSNEEVKNA